MKTAPFDREPPFVLLPVREKLWQRLIRQAIGIFDRKRLKQHGLAGNLEALKANQAHSQVGNNNAVANDLSIYALKSHGLQGHVSYSIPEAIGNRSVNENERSGSAGNSGNLALNSRNYFGGAQGVFAHDGSYKFFKWDNAKGCMVPYEPSTPVIQRFQRSLDAFMRSWRLG